MKKVMKEWSDAYTAALSSRELAGAGLCPGRMYKELEVSMDGLLSTMQQMNAFAVGTGMVGAANRMK